MKSLCPVCSNKVVLIGIQKGKLDKRDFSLMTCESCRFTYVENYRSDFSKIYNEDYYSGRGADPMVNYLYELQNPQKTIRNYEWEGLYEIFNYLLPRGGSWLDYGCGSGGLVRYVLDKGVNIIGAEDGWAANQGRQIGLPIMHIDEIDQYSQQFDFISAVEVLEHIPQPIEFLKKIRKLLKPGGFFFLTTGNAKPWRKNLLGWSYTQCPDVHISFFEPATLAECLVKSGFHSEQNKFNSGFVNIIKYKILKNFGIKNKTFLFDLLPWSLISRIVDAKYGVSKHPYGVAK